MSRPRTSLERALALRRIEAFRRLGMEQLAELARACREERHAQGAELFREGDPPGPLLLILEGCVVLERRGQSFGEAGPGEPLGAWSLFEDRPRRGTARAADDVTVLVLEREPFYEILADHPEIVRGVVQDLVGRLLEAAGLAEEEVR